MNLRAGAEGKNRRKRTRRDEFEGRGRREE